MIEDARKKIKDEMKKENNSYVSVIGEYLLEKLEEDPTAAVKILEDSKTIMGSLEVMKKEAREHKVGNVGVITPEHGFAIVMEYYGITVGQAKKKEDEFDVKLDDLL